MKFTTVVILIFGSLSMNAESALEVTETEAFYKRFAFDGMSSPDFTDDDVRKIISIGIASENQQIASYTVRALAIYAAAHEVDSYPDYQPGGKMPDRGDLAVPGLKEFLFDRFRSKAIGPEDDPRHPSWSFVPRPLAYFYPEDEDVLGFIWELSETTATRHGTMQLLNLGMHSSSDAIQYRIESLSIRESSEWEPHLKHAAWGLGKHRTLDGLDALVKRLHGEPHKDMYHLVDAIGEYGSDALPYLEELSDLYLESGEVPNKHQFEEHFKAMLRNLHEHSKTQR